MEKTEYLKLNKPSAKDIADITALLHNWDTIDEEAKRVSEELGKNVGEKITVTSNLAIGGINSGERFENVTSNDMWNRLLKKELNPRVTLLSDISSSTVREIGTRITANFTASAIKRSEDIVKVQWESKISGFNKVEAVVNPDSGEYTNSATFATEAIFSIMATDLGNNIGKASITFPFVHPTYYGMMPSGSTLQDITSESIKSKTKLLQKKGHISVRVTASAERLCFAYPSAYGDLNKIMDVANGFNIITAFQKRTLTIPTLDGSNTTYNVYLSSQDGVYANKNIQCEF